MCRAGLSAADELLVFILGPFGLKVVPLIRLITSHYLLFSAKGSQLLTRRLLGFGTYLTDRYQVFTTDSTQSAHIVLSSGIPQGSGLGSTQFIAYTEDTTSIFPSHNIQYHLFADDTAQSLIFQTSSSVSRNASKI